MEYEIKDGGCSFDLYHRLPNGKKQKIDRYVDLLLEVNRYINLVSRKISPEGLLQLIEETLFLNRLIKGHNIVDAGSGNGLLGVPLAILNTNKRIFLVESKPKKAGFLKQIANTIDLVNLEVWNMGIQEFFHKKKGSYSKTIVTRGFSSHEELLEFYKKGMVDEVLLISSLNKIKKIGKEVENRCQKIYNIPFRETLKVLKILKNGDCFT
jgi:16S rRNA (guanine(527)-N(7))-methyltransferase RsmG